MKNEQKHETERSLSHGLHRNKTEKVTPIADNKWSQSHYEISAHSW